MSRRDENRAQVHLMAERGSTFAGRVVDAGPVAVERLVDAWALVDAQYVLKSWGDDGIDLRRWSRRPEVADAIRDAREAVARAARLAHEVALEPARVAREEADR
jgi:hypothetical protein